jgi:superfamily I DNA and/or RNA helicase
VKKSDIGVIAPYNAQVNMIKKLIRHSPDLHQLPLPGQAASRINHIEVSSVDGFQGREKEIIIISMVTTQKLALKLFRSVRTPSTKSASSQTRDA